MSYSEYNEIHNASTNSDIEQYLQQCHDDGEDADFLDGSLCSRKVPMKLLIKVLIIKVPKRSWISHYAPSPVLAALNVLYNLQLLRLL